MIWLDRRVIYWKNGKNKNLKQIHEHFWKNQIIKDKTVLFNKYLNKAHILHSQLETSHENFKLFHNPPGPRYILSTSQVLSELTSQLTHTSYT